MWNAQSHQIWQNHGQSHLIWNLTTGDADFAHLALQLRRRGIRVEVAATAQTLGTGLKGAANEVIDLVPLFETFELMKPGD